MRKALILPAVSVAGGVVGLAVRQLYLRQAFEPGTGLPVSGQPVTGGLWAVAIVTAVAIVLLSGGKHRTFEKNYVRAFGGGSRRSGGQNTARRGENIMARLELTFEEAAFGCDKELSVPRIENCAACSGTGSADGNVETCSKCRGTGQERVVQNFMGMQMQSTAPCSQCGGKGKIIKTPCNTCKGKGKVRRTNKVVVKVPAGVNDGQSVRVRGEGNVGSGGAPNGDLLAEVHIKSHKLFKRREFDVYCEVPISFAQAALGAEIEVPTLDGKVSYTIPEGTQTGREFILRGKGIPQVGNPKLRGDHHFSVVVETPTKLTNEQKELLRQFDGTVSRSVTPKRKGFQDILNDFFKEK